MIPSVWGQTQWPGKRTPTLINIGHGLPAVKLFHKLKNSGDPEDTSLEDKHVPTHVPVLFIMPDTPQFIAQKMPFGSSNYNSSTKVKVWMVGGLSGLPEGTEWSPELFKEKVVFPPAEGKCNLEANLKREKGEELRRINRIINLVTLSDSVHGTLDWLLFYKPKEVNSFAESDGGKWRKSVMSDEMLTATLSAEGTKRLTGRGDVL
ncbi:hypothetical protein BDK51DRAFT_31070 [Blyttiomyces helicus]|uniref:Uncharacterized protein n=1 Tax=Blyttiomyces helicus TaxID=388810 RepID=A0A4P9WA50_9FUNG|nr:hypothetical protein BDK51DRAFT_31070 [Blyttiomyces helicus]|eukprot:RKO89082.1 hypothetical protein BDK51DRAFT_31070 [Blyttiomyces helicus]